MSMANVKDFQRDDSTTAGIQEAIDSLPEGGGTVFIPAGVYLLRGSVRPRPSTILRGEGPGTALTRAAPVVKRLAEPTVKNETRLVLEDTCGIRPGDQLWISHLGQHGWHSRYLGVAEVGEKWVDGKLLYGDPERVYDPKEKAWAGNYFPAIWIHETNRVTIDSITIDGGDFEYDPEHFGDFVCAGIHTRRSFELRIRDVTVRRWPSDGIGVQGGGAFVNGCVAEDCLGVGLHPGTGISQSVWTGNISQRNRSGLLFCQRVRNTIVAHNVILDNRESGIWGLGDPDRYNVVSGNCCAGNGRYGIEATKAVGNTITANVCRNNSQQSPGTYAGIHLEQHRDNVVTGNLCLDDQENPTQARGIDAINPLGPNLIRNNLCPPASTYWTVWKEPDRKAPVSDNMRA